MNKFDVLNIVEGTSYTGKTVDSCKDVIINLPFQKPFVLSVPCEELNEKDIAKSVVAYLSKIITKDRIKMS